MKTVKDADRFCGGRRVRDFVLVGGWRRFLCQLMMPRPSRQSPRGYVSGTISHAAVLKLLGTQVAVASPPPWATEEGTKQGRGSVHGDQRFSLRQEVPQAQTRIAWASGWLPVGKDDVPAATPPRKQVPRVGRTLGLGLGWHRKV